MFTPLHNRILKEIDQFLEETGVAATVLGREAVGDAKAIWRLRRGDNLTLHSVNALFQRMDGIRGELWMEKLYQAQTAASLRQGGTQ